jgi:hypothetical protein
MKYKIHILNISIAILFLKLFRNFLSYVLELYHILPEEHTIPYHINFIEFLYPLVVFAVTIILARFLIERPTIFARNLFILIQMIVQFYIIVYVHLEWVSSLDAPDLVMQIIGLFIVIGCITFILTSILIYLAYLILRDDRLTSNAVVGNLS